MTHENERARPVYGWAMVDEDGIRLDVIYEDAHKADALKDWEDEMNRFGYRLARVVVQEARDE